MSDKPVLSTAELSDLVADLVRLNKHSCLLGVSSCKLIEVLGFNSPWTTQYTYDTVSDLRFQATLLRKLAERVDKVAKKAKRRMVAKTTSAK